MASAKVQHIARFAVQDWRTSRVRSRSAMTADPLLRTVYLELLFALYEAGGELPADPDILADVLLLPAAEISRCLPLLSQLGENGRGGIVIDGETLRNRRVTEDIQKQKEYSEGQAAHAKKRWENDTAKKATHKLPTGYPQASLNSEMGTQCQPKPKPSPKPVPEPLPVPMKQEDPPTHPAPAREMGADAPAPPSLRSRSPERKRFEPPPLPPPLDTPEIQSEWRAFAEHRREIRKPLTRIAAEHAARELVEWGPTRALAALRHTMAKGWQGLREPEVNGRNGGERGARSAPRNERGNPGASDEIMEYGAEIQRGLGEW